MSDQSPELDPKQSAAIVCLLEQPTVRAAAEAANVGESTLRRWLREERFASAYRSAQRTLFDLAIGHIQNATVEAVKTLRDIMSSTAAPETARVTAARTVLDLAKQSVSLHDLENRLNQLEDALKKLGESS